MGRVAVVGSRKVGGGCVDGVVDVDVDVRHSSRDVLRVG